MNFNLTYIFIIIIVIYIYCYFIFPSTVQILQTTIKDFNFPLLYMRQPIVISDYLQDKETLINSWFNYNFIRKIDDYDYSNQWLHNKNKYLFINANEDTEIIIYKASFSFIIPEEHDRIIAIKLEKNQSLIVPYKWKYYIKKMDDIDLWVINDPITFFLGLVF